MFDKNTINGNPTNPSNATNNSTSSNPTNLMGKVTGIFGKYIKPGRKHMFTIAFVLMIICTIINLVLQKAVKKPNTAVTFTRIFCGMIIVVTWIIIMISVNWSAIGGSLPKMPSGKTVHGSSVCFKDYVTHSKFFYVGLILAFIGFVIPPLWKTIREKAMKKENNIPKSVAAIMNLMMAAGIGLIFISLNFSSATKLGVSKYMTWTTFFIVLVIAVVLLFVYGYCVAIRHKKQLQQNWPSYRCKPYVIPIAGWVGPKGTSTVENMGSCVKTMAKELFDLFLHPWVTLFDLFKDILKEITMDIQDLRKMIYYIRNVIKDGLVDVANKTYAAYYRIAVLFKMIRNLLLSIFYVLRSLLYVLDYAFSTLASLWNGSIGGVARFFCFDSNTLIKMVDGNQKQIRNIHLGDQLWQGGFVKGVIKVKKGGSQMYDYNGIKVAGSHLVYEFDEWKRVEDSMIAVPINYEKEWIHCLIVDNNKIWVGETLFADYFEKSETNLNKQIQQLILSKLNNKNITLPKNECYPLGWGFSISVLQKIINNCQKIDGFVELDLDDDMYDLGNGMIFSGDHIVLDPVDDVWKRVKELSEAKRVDRWSGKIYSVLTPNGKFKLDKYTFVDFEQVMDEEVNDKIDTLVMNVKQMNIN